MKANPVYLLLTLIVGIAIGWVLNHTLGDGAGDDPAAGPPAPQRSASPRGERVTVVHDRDGKRDPVAAIRRVARKLELSPLVGMDMESMFDAYESIRWMQPDDIRQALRALESEPPSQSGMMLNFMLMGLWGKLDGQGAMEYAAKLERPQERMMGLMSGLMGWMKYEPYVAYDWYQKNRDDLKGGMMGGIQMDGMFLASMAQRDMTLTFSELSKLSGLKQKNALMMVSSSIGMDAERRTRFLEELEKTDDASLKRDGVRGLISSWAMADPQEAAAFIEARRAEHPDDHAELQTSLTSSWTMVDPEAALEWQVGHDEISDDGKKRLASSFAQWVTTDSAEASAWLEKQSPEWRSDALYQQAANRLLWSGEHETASQWAGQIQDAAERSTTLGSVYERWKDDEPERAAEWLQAQDPALRAELEAKLPPAE